MGGSASGVATVQFQRSPAGAGTWTNQAASLDTTTVADGQYDLRVITTDNAGNAFTSATITIRVDNTLPTGTVTAPANGAEIGVPPIALTSNSADAGGSGVDSVVFERSPAGAGTWSATAASWNTASGPDAVADGSYDLRVKTTDNAGNVFSVARDHRARRPHRARDDRVARPRLAEQRAGHRQLLGGRRRRLGRQHHLLPRRRRQPPARALR